MTKQLHHRDWAQVSMDLRPILVVPVYKGGERFTRCLASIEKAEQYFSAVLLSINSDPGSADLIQARDFQDRSGIHVQVINTTFELNSMSHCRFWSKYLQDCKIPESKHLMWLGHDDELDTKGLADICHAGDWSLSPDTMYLGPWKLRHEPAQGLYVIPDDENLETWTCFPKQERKPLGAMKWACDQLFHPTYLNLTGGVFPLSSMLEIVRFRVKKISGMRLEMTLATAPGSLWITEFREPITIVCGRSDSDRATIPRAEAISDDRRLLIWLIRFAFVNPSARFQLTKTLVGMGVLRIKVLLGLTQLPGEDWVVRS